MKLIEFSDTTLDDYKGQDLYPVFMQFGEECFELISKPSQKENSWIIFEKIFFNRIYGVKKEYIDSLFEKYLLKDKTTNGQIIFRHDPKVWIKGKKACKFCNNGYVRSFKDNTYCLDLCKKVKNESQLKNFKLYLCLSEDIDSAEYLKEYAKLVKQYRSKRKYKIKKGNLIVSRINAEILTPQEKLFSYIEKEYDSKILLGDILLDEEQEKILDEYMKEELSVFAYGGDDWNGVDYLNAIHSTKTFAYGLVRYAMTYYNKRHGGDFWPHFKEKYGFLIPTNKQLSMHYVYREILNSTGRDDMLSDNPGNYIDEITMQSFVSDHSSKQLFDYLFAFWRVDLNREIETLYQELAFFDDLIDAMRNRSQNIMSHTAHLLEFARVRPVFKTRVKRILKLMDDCFWNDKRCKENGNRINHLLNEWMDDSSCAFSNERVYKQRHALIKDKDGIVYRTPVLKMDAYSNKIRLILPIQRLIHCEKENHPCWVIKTSDGVIEKTVHPEYKKDKISYYVDSEWIDIPLSSSLSEFTIDLLRDEDGITEKSFKIASSDVRLFDQKGRCIDYQNNIVQEGNLTVISRDKDYPYMLDGQFSTVAMNGLYLKNGEVKEGQIIVFPGNYGILVGHKFLEGYDEKHFVKGASLIGEEGQIYQISNTLPNLLFKAKPDEIGGISLSINGKPNKVFDRVTAFRLKDDLEEIGYVLDISSFIKEDGLYEIFLSYPKMHRQTSLLHVAYIKDFNYEFVNAPYVFDIRATLRFSLKMRFEEESNKRYLNNWNQGANWAKQFEFDFSQRDPGKESYCDLVQDRKISLTYLLKDKKYKVQFDIPALFWRFDEKDEYNVKKPTDITLKELKQDKKRLYVTGPFDFSRMFIYTNDDVEVAEEESEIRIQDLNHPYFDLSKILHWCNEDFSQSRIKLSLHLDEKKEKDFIDVICRSELKDVALVGDFENNVLYGIVDILGNEEYTITIYRDGELVGEDVRIENGEFSVDAELKSGIYECYVYEIADDEEDDFDSGSSSKLLNPEPKYSKLISLRELEGTSLTIRGFHDSKNRCTPFMFKQRYYLRDLKRVEYADLMKDGYDIVGIWDEKFCDEEAQAEMVWYKGKIPVSGIEMPVLVSFKDLNDMSSIVILEIVEKDCYELLIDNDSHRIISNRQLLPSSYAYKKKKSTCVSFYDDENCWDVRI